MIKVNYKNSNNMDYCFIFPSNYLNKESLQQHYLKFLTSHGLSGLIVPLPPIKGKKLKISDAKDYLNSIQSLLKDFNIKIIMVTDGELFKVISKQKKVEMFYGIASLNKYNNLSKYVIPIPNYASLIYAQDNETKIDLSLEAVKNICLGNSKVLGDNIVHKAFYLASPTAIKERLDVLLRFPKLTVDIETYGLKFVSCGLATISFAINEHNGAAFLVEQSQSKENTTLIKQYLKQFFTQYTGTIIVHNGGFDLTVLIYQLFMDCDTTNYDGLLQGLQQLTKNFDDTKLIAYLSLNSASEYRASLGLKSLSFEFTGNYAVEDDKILDVAKIPCKELLEYNLKDTLATWYVYKKYYPIMVRDSQLPIYQQIFKPALIDIIKMQLVGVPIDMEKVKKTYKHFKRRNEKYLKIIYSHPLVIEGTKLINEKAYQKEVNKYPNKKINREKFSEVCNIASPNQLQVILYDLIGLPIIDTTDTGNPSTGGKTIKKLINHTNDPSVKYLLKFLYAQSKITKILSDFMPTLKKAYKDKNGNHWVHGNFNLGGTISGRLSSSKINLQNLPATGSPYAKPFKKMFVAPKGWVMVGLDFDALEDKISALTTNDRNKIKVYTEGYDGHCLRAYYYFSEQMPDINPEDVKSVNSINKKYPELRQLSKSPTFALTYAGTVFTLINKFGFSREEAERMYNRYHELYSESDAWVQRKIEEACSKGYTEGAFGLRIRSPMLKQTVLGTKSTPYMATKESRSIGNALGQSWCLLNSRCATEFLNRVEAFGYSKDILPIMAIHDANYFLVKQDLEIISWVNKHLPECAAWQNHEDIYHDTVKLSGSVDIFYPSWAHSTTLNPKATTEEIKTILNNIGIEV